MKVMLKLLITGLTLIFIFSSCGKYEDGPGFSVLTKKHRITGNWTGVPYFSAMWDDSKVNESNQMNIYKDGTITFKQDTVVSIANWEFIEDKESIAVTNFYLQSKASTVFRIHRLTNKELLLKEVDGKEYHYIKM